MSKIYEGNYQKEIIKQIEAGNPIAAIIADLIAEHRSRAIQMQNLYRRHKNQSASSWSEEILPIDHDGIPIFAREYDNELKTNHRLHSDFLNRIRLTLVGYMGNGISILVNSKKYDSEPLLKKAELTISDFVKFNNELKNNTTRVSDCVLLGTSYTLLFQDGKDLRTLQLCPWETIIIKDASLDKTMFAMRYWTIEDKVLDEKYTRIEWYDDKKIYYYRSIKNLDDSMSYVPLQVTTLVNGVQKTVISKPHLMADVPIIEFPKNEQRIGDCEISLSLQDAYDIALSDLSSEVAQLRLSYLVGQSVGTKLDDAFREQLKQTGILTCRSDGKWYFVEKEIASEAIEKLLDRLERNIYAFSNSVDFTSKEYSGNMPIMAFQLKTKPLEESAKETENMFKKSFLDMYTIIVDFWKRFKSIDVDPLSLSFEFTRNIPSNIKEEVENFKKLKGLISDSLALSRLSFVTDVQEEIERQKEGK